jgi:hypothetical protein
MAQYPLKDLGFAHDVDDFHLVTAPRTTKRVCFPDLFDEFSPGF